MLPIPRSFAQWLDVIEQMKSGLRDQETLELMHKGGYDFSGVGAERFVQELTAAVNARIDRAHGAFQREMAYAGNERILVNAMLRFRKEFRFLHGAIDLHFIPAEYHRKLDDLITQQARKVQQSLEQSARRDKSGRLASIVRNNRVDT
jgi:hypothetical protein